MKPSPKPKVDSQAILKKIEDRKHDRKKTSLYLSALLFERFKAACGSASISEVVEELMSSFVESVEKKPSK